MWDTHDLCLTNDIFPPYVSFQARLVSSLFLAAAFWLDFPRAVMQSFVACCQLPRLVCGRIAFCVCWTFLLALARNDKQIPDSAERLAQERNQTPDVIVPDSREFEQVSGHTAHANADTAATRQVRWSLPSRPREALQRDPGASVLSAPRRNARASQTYGIQFTCAVAQPTNAQCIPRDVVWWRPEASP